MNAHTAVTEEDLTNAVRILLETGAATDQESRNQSLADWWNNGSRHLVPASTPMQPGNEATTDLLTSASRSLESLSLPNFHDLPETVGETISYLECISTFKETFDQAVEANGVQNHQLNERLRGLPRSEDAEQWLQHRRHQGDLDTVREALLTHKTLSTLGYPCQCTED